MRVLASAIGGEGHLGPLLPFLDAAGAAGDEVLVVVPREQEETVRTGGYPYLLSRGVDPALTRAIRDAMAVGTAEERTRLAEIDLFGRACTEAALPGMRSACERFRPDLILREPCDYASAIEAHRRSIPTAQVAISPGAADWGGLHLAADAIELIAPGVTAAIERAPYLSRFPEIADAFPDTRAYGFAVDIAERRVEEPPVVWITFGTVNSSFAALDATWQVVLHAVEALPIRVEATVGRGGSIGDAPSTVRVTEWLELRDILGRASAVICHGGSGTTLAALGAGVPLVVIPLIADQPANATMVEDLGAGIAIRAESDGGLRGLSSEDVPRLRAAIRAVLDDERYSRAAQRVADVLQQRGSPGAALERLRSELR